MTDPDNTPQTWQWLEDASGTRDGMAVAIDRFTGAVVGLFADREHTPNAVPGEDVTWHMRAHDWGLGVVAGTPSQGGAGAPAHWQRAHSIAVSGSEATIEYRIGTWNVHVVRVLDGGRLHERYRVVNRGGPIDVGQLQVFIPFSTDLVGGAAGARDRYNAHVWAGGERSWVRAVPATGEGPSLGLVLTDGSAVGYGLSGTSDHAGAPVRGDISLVFVDSLAEGHIPRSLMADDTSDMDSRALPGSTPVALGEGEELTFGWTVVATQTDAEWDAVQNELGPAQQLKLPGFVAEVGENAAASLPNDVWVADGDVAMLGATGAALEAVGVGVTHVGVGDRQHPREFIEWGVVDSLEESVDKRTAFIARHQQVSEPGTLSGALVPYDNVVHARLEVPSRHDFNAGRERLGMGVLLAQRLQRGAEPRVRAAFDLYLEFVQRELVGSDGTVWDSPGDRSVNRLYNYPWVARFFLEVFEVTRDGSHLEQYLDVVRRFFEHGGREFYPINLPVARGLGLLRKIGADAEAKEVTALHLTHAEAIAERGTDYPNSEVPFEQSIVAPAASLLLETALVTGDSRWARAAQPHLTILRRFAGQQPSAYLHGVPLRHWDGYWFGRDERWGDVMPHHWSALSAWAFALDSFLATGKVSHEAHQISRATRLAFFENGSASGAFVYPRLVNGRAGYRWDPLANDQDWALVTALDIDYLKNGKYS